MAFSGVVHACPLCPVDAVGPDGKRVACAGCGASIWRDNAWDEFDAAMAKRREAQGLPPHHPILDCCTACAVPKAERREPRPD